VCNALHLIVLRVQWLSKPSGMADDELVVVGMRRIERAGDPTQSAAQNLQALQQLADVRSASLNSPLPFGGATYVCTIRPADVDDPKESVAAFYVASANAPETLGWRMAEGRSFRQDELQWGDIEQVVPREFALPSVIVNRALADELYPAGSALGRPVYIFADTPATIVGISDDMQSVPIDNIERRNTMLLPLQPSDDNAHYVLRVPPEQRGTLLRAAADTLAVSDPSRVTTGQVYRSEARSSFFAQDRSMVWLLSIVVVMLLIVTAFGIVGLASFWVQQRTRMIGTRRALGATRGQIVRNFQLENFLLTSFGSALGMLGAYATSAVLMRSWELPALPWTYLGVGTLTLWTLGQLAVYALARRAAAVPPMVALRS
jgi:putative ABC transport system permease protein